MALPSAFLCVCVLVGFLSATACTAQEIQTIDPGRQVYLSYGCATCHGPNGHGDGPVFKKASVKLPDFHDSKTYLHGNTKDRIKSNIKLGLHTGDRIMPAFQHLTDQELEMLADYLLSLQQEKESP